MLRTRVPKGTRFQSRQYSQYHVNFFFVESSSFSQDALRHLYSLQSNRNTVEQWAKERRQNVTVNVTKEMEHLLNITEINVIRLLPFLKFTPQINQIECLPVIHVAGTKGRTKSFQFRVESSKGKGSTCAFIESVLRGMGYRTGMYTSPHLVSVRERIQINGNPISKKQFEDTFWFCWERLMTGRVVRQFG
jgi:hypothetical protein